MDHAIWTEKYRPHTFSEIKGQIGIVERVKAFVDQRNMPHLMFAGPPGVGKSTLALVVARELFGETWRQNFIELNASDERGIDVIRVKVKDFARTRALGDVPFKIIFLDECDALTREAQQALRRTMEQYTITTRFILSCNYSSKIIDPVQSRCAVFRFKPLSSDELKAVVDRIVADEGISITPEARDSLIDISEGDCRRISTLLQGCAALSSKVDDKMVRSFAAVANPSEVAEVLKLALANKFEDARKKLLDVMLAYGLSGIDMIKQIQKQILDIDLDSRKKMQLYADCGEIEFRLTEGSDEYVQLESLLARFCLAGSK
ncbi:MAG: replication factor C small subunit [Nanoarchaeota archaeon]|nr:replication factor C small subunit [Nanoarchaeota archaeon]